MRIIFFINLLSIMLNSHGQPVFGPMVRSFPVTGGYSKNFQDVFSFTTNQATLASMKNPAIGLYSEKRFMIRELHLFQFATAIPGSFGVFGILISYAGNGVFNETHTAFSFAKKVTELLSIGIQFSYFGYRASGIQRGKLVNGDVGMLFQVSEKLQAGVQLKNLFPIKNAELKMPVIYSAGLGYDCSEKVLLNAGIVKQQAFRARITVALNYLVVPSLFIQCGSSGLENVFFLGVGIKRKGEKLEINAGYHSQLGITPSLALMFPIVKKGKE